MYKDLETAFETVFSVQNNPFNLCVGVANYQRIFVVNKLVLNAIFKLSI